VGQSVPPSVPSQPKAVPAINCIIFSKDRAMQLDACLRTIETLAPYEGPITVIYASSSSEFDAAYRSIEFGKRVRLHAEGGDFRSAVLAAVDVGEARTVFHTDDDVFFRSPLSPPVLEEGFAAFSLRLGLNTTYCYPFRRSQLLPDFVDDGALLAWDWTRARDDFSYPMSLDGHVFDTSLLLRMLRRAQFTNPNELEEELHVRRHLAPRWMVACRESAMTSIPANTVSTTHANRAQLNPETSPEMLNERFLLGERIDIDRMNFSNVCAAHTEVPFAFKRVDD
jgi:hypothetical protein